MVQVTETHDIGVTVIPNRTHYGTLTQALEWVMERRSLWGSYAVTWTVRVNGKLVGAYI